MTEKFIFQITSAVITCQKRKGFIGVPQRSRPGRFIDQTEAPGTVFQNPGILSDHAALDDMLFLGIIRNIVVHLLPVEKEKARHEKVSVHLLHGTRAVVAGLAPAGRRIVESNMFFLLSGQGQGMVLYKRLLRVQIQAVVISRELPVKRKNNSFIRRKN